jgi:TIR domain-containing protein
MSGQIFISYRREESRWSARSLHDRLCRDFDLKQIFMDIDAIALGEDFVKAIETTVARCDVLVAVIGNNWLDSKDDRGDRRLENPEDFVRMEIATALKREIRVIPVLVDGALMPRSTDLPEDLRLLVRRNALRITDTSFDGDCQRLVAAIKQVLEKNAAEQREREKKERLEAERKRSEQEQAERQERERLDAERREKERLDAEARKRSSEMLEAELRKRQEHGPQSQPTSVAQGDDADRGSQSKPTSDRKAKSGIRVFLEPEWLRLMAKFSFVPFALVLLSFLFPFRNFADGLKTSGLTLVTWVSTHQILFTTRTLIAFLCPILVLISSFLKYRCKRVSEAIGSWVSVISLVSFIECVVPHMPPSEIGAGFIFACIFAAAGALIKTWLLIHRRKLKPG